MNRSVVSSGIAAKVRRAHAGDALQICQLYIEAYTPAEGGEARDHYPFPQILDPCWVAYAVQQESIVWGVAEIDGRVSASAAALRNIGGIHDQVAEVFGVVVAIPARRTGIATKLLEFVCNELGPADFILCEARTAEPGGWKVARNCGFSPIGFEPFAHAMPVGFESMVLTAKIRNTFKSRAEVPRCLAPPAKRLASTILELPAEAETLTRQSANDCRESSNSPVPLANEAVPLEVRRDDTAGKSVFDDWANDFADRTGVVNLNPLEGIDVKFQRCTNLFYIALINQSIVGSARIAWDRTDCRMRILGMRLKVPRLERPFLLAIVADLARGAGPAPLAVIVNVRRDAFEIQWSLEEAGFFPTAYFPSLLGTSDGRADALQYTWLRSHRREGMARFTSDIDWPKAQAIIEHVLGLAASGCTRP